MNRFEFYSNLQEYNFLQHHGIIGQKWGVRRFQNPDGTLTEEGKKRYLNPDGTLSDKAPTKIKSAYSRYKQAEQQKAAESGELYQDDYVYSKEKQSEKLNRAKSNNMYDIDFVESIQNAENLSDEDTLKEYQAYLKNPHQYMKEIEVDGTGKIVKSLSGINNKPKTEKKEKIKEETKENNKPDTVIKAEQVNEWLNELGDKRNNMSESDIWKYIGKKSEEEMKKRGVDIKGMTKKQNSETPKSLKEVKKETSKLLKGGVLGGWAMLNKAMDELGFTAEERKNLSASDWEAINDKLRNMRKK